MQAFEQLEKELEEWSNVDRVVGCSSGTAALHLVLEALKLPPKSEVIIPDLTMIACARAVTLAGLTPVFADCDKTLNMSMHSLGSLVTLNTSAIMAVHIYGRRCNMEAIYEIASPYGIKVIEDRAEFHVPYQDHERRPDAVCWSFYRNKVIHGEEGGAIGFHYNEDEFYRAKSLRSLGFTEEHTYMHLPRGHNYRLSNLHAMAIGMSLAKYGTEVLARQIICNRYDALCPVEYRLPSRECNWVYDLRIPRMLALAQTKVIKALKAAGIEARYCFKPMHLQSEYFDFNLAPRYSRSEALAASREVIYLPIQPHVTTEESIENAFTIIKSTL